MTQSIQAITPSPATPVEYVILYADTNRNREVDVGDDIVAKDRIYHIQEMTDEDVTLISSRGSHQPHAITAIVERQNFDDFMRRLALGPRITFTDQGDAGLSVGDRLIEHPVYFVPPVDGEEEGVRATEKAVVEQCQTTHWITDASQAKTGGRIGVQSAIACTTDLVGSIPPADWGDATPQNYLDLSLLILLLQN